MASDGANRSGLLTAGGVLSIVGGISQIICSGLMIEAFVSYSSVHWRLIYALFLPGLPDAWREYVLRYALFGSQYVWFPIDFPIQWAIIGGCLGVLGIVAVVGGVSAIRRKSVGLSLTGAICALPSVFVGILAIIFVALGKREFNGGRNEDGN